MADATAGSVEQPQCDLSMTDDQVVLLLMDYIVAFRRRDWGDQTRQRFAHSLRGVADTLAPQPASAPAAPPAA